MFRALLYKDFLLLRVYLRISFFTSILIYPVGFGLVFWVTESYLDEASKQLTSQVHTTLAGASVYGLVLTSLFAAIIAASTIALERGDRSCEFLACLPPTRWQNLTSKLLLLLCAVGGMLLLHNSAAWLASCMTAYVRAADVVRTTDLDTSFIRNLVTTCVIFCITGFSFAGSSLMKSNGGPALMGLMSPILSLSIVTGLGRLIDVPYEGDTFAIRYAIISATLGLTMLVCGCLWYLNRSEP